MPDRNDMRDQWDRSVGNEGEKPDWKEWRNFNAADLGDALAGWFGKDRFGNPLTKAPILPRQESEQIMQSLSKTMEDEPTILFLSAHPSNAQPLQLQWEEHRIRAELEKTKYGRQFRLETRPKITFSDLQRYLLETTPTILHFSGHGTVPGIMVENERREAHLIPAQNLATLLGLPVIRRRLRLVILNACLSAQQAQAIATQIEAVVGMSRNIGDEAAIAFAAGLYAALGTGTDVETAFVVAKNQIGIDSSQNLSETDTPLMFVRPDAVPGQIFPLKI